MDHLTSIFGLLGRTFPAEGRDETSSNVVVVPLFSHRVGGLVEIPFQRSQLVAFHAFATLLRDGSGEATAWLCDDESMELGTVDVTAHASVVVMEAGDPKIGEVRDLAGLWQSMLKGSSWTLASGELPLEIVRARHRSRSSAPIERGWMVLAGADCASLTFLFGEDVVARASRPR